MSVIQILKDNNFIEDGEIEVYILLDLVKNWPTIKDDDYDEELDLENWEITELNDDKIVAIPLEYDDTITLGWLTQKQKELSPIARSYLTMLKNHIKGFGFEIYGEE